MCVVTMVWTLGCMIHELNKCIFIDSEMEKRPVIIFYDSANCVFICMPMQGPPWCRKAYSRLHVTIYCKSSCVLNLWIWLVEACKVSDLQLNVSRSAMGPIPYYLFQNRHMWISSSSFFHEHRLNSTRTDITIKHYLYNW